MAISEKYILNRGIYFPSDENDSVPGTDSDNYLLEILSQSSDLSSGSEELYDRIIDSQSRRAFSPGGANLLHCFFEQLKGKSVLQVGTSGGNLTRYLSEIAFHVCALESDIHLAMATSARCRDLKNVEIICDTLDEFRSNDKFDVITIIDVFEKSSNQNERETYSTLLKNASKFLSPDGILILAANNKCGIVHLNTVQSEKIETKIENGSISFSKTELEDIIKSAGLYINQTAYPFPNFIEPEVIVFESALTKKFDVSNLLLGKLLPGDDVSVATNLIISNLIQNDLIRHLSNSFLFVCSAQKQESSNKKEVVLAETFSSYRKKIFTKKNQFIQVGKKIKVNRYRLYNNPNQSNSKVSNILVDELYTRGQLLIWDAIIILGKREWSFAEIQTWASSYLSILKAFSFEQNGRTLLKGGYVDLSPFNIIKRDDGTVYVFDQEWEYKEDLPLFYILYRGLLHSLLRLGKIDQPKGREFESIEKIVIALVRELIEFDDENLSFCREKEIEFLSETAIGSRIGIPDRSLVSRSKGNVVSDQPFNKFLEKISFQIFWKTVSDLEYSESNSITVDTIIKGKEVLEQTIIGGGPINSIRIDPTNETGMLYLEQITLIRKSGIRQFEWKGDSSSNFEFKGIVGFGSVLYPGKRLLIFIDNDPIIDISSAVKDFDEEQITVQIYFSKITSDDWSEELVGINQSGKASQIELAQIDKMNDSLEELKKIMINQGRILKTIEKKVTKN